MTRCTCYDVLIVKDLNRWFKEKWVDVSRKDKDGKHPPCGRSKAKKSSKGYPKCRPSVKVSGKTPKTSGSMSEGQKQAATKRKRSKKQGVGGKPTIVKSVLVKAPIVDTDIPGVRMAYNMDFSEPVIGGQPYAYGKNDKITQMTPNDYFDIVGQGAEEHNEPPVGGRDAEYRWDGRQFTSQGGSRENIARIIEGMKAGMPIGMPELSFNNKNYTGMQEGGHRMEALRQLGHGETKVPVFQHHRNL
tara:strand:+ start:27 stop:761 length:735 start_codon:yes stop_codon:yes gene_type:complete